MTIWGQYGKGGKGLDATVFAGAIADADMDSTDNAGAGKLIRNEISDIPQR